MSLPAAARPYRDFLTPSLHRRFTRSSVYTIGLCYAVAIWMGDWNHRLWSWFPIGPVGIRVLLLYISTLFVYLIRVSQWHVGKRNTTYPFEVFQKVVLSKRTFVTVGSYAMSAWFYSEVYIWSQYSKSKLQFTLDHGKFTERIKLNERPVYLRFLFVILAVVQGALHLWYDYDQIRVPIKKTKDGASRNRSQAFPYVFVPLATKSAMSVAVALVAGTFVYFGILRDYIWNWHYCVARFLVSLSKNPKPTGLAPFMNLVIIFAVQGVCLALLWNFTNHTFTQLISEEPLKKEQPITSDSKDPNGSLLNGLKSKKDDVKAIAIWELALITQRFADRRKTIYIETDRKKDATHVQITNICLAEIRRITARIEAVTNPSIASSQNGSSNALVKVDLVPQITPPLTDTKIVGKDTPPATGWQHIGAAATSIARSHSSPANVDKSYAKEYLKKGQAKASSGLVQAETVWESYRNKIATSPFGWPFRHSLQRTATTVITGAPYSRQSVLIHAIETLTNLTLNSLREDERGQFQRGVPDIIRVFTSTVQSIEAYIQGLDVHWTDIATLAKPEVERRKVPDVDIVTAELRGGLERIVGAFNEYLGNMDISAQDVMAAKRLISKGPEVAEIR